MLPEDCAPNWEFKLPTFVLVANDVAAATAFAGSEVLEPEPDEPGGGCCSGRFR